MVIKELKEKTECPKCDDCVSRADVLKYKCDCYDAQNHLLYAVPTGHIMRLPSVAPKQKAGKAVFKSEKGFWVCNQCGERVHTWDKYCSECGAKLKGNE